MQPQRLLARVVGHDRSTEMNANVCTVLLVLVSTRREYFFGGHTVTLDAADGASAEGLSLCPPRPGLSRFSQDSSQAVAAERLAPTNGAVLRHALLAPPGPRSHEIFTPGAQSNAGHWPCPLRPRCHRAGVQMRRPRTPSACRRGRNTPGHPSYERCCNRTR